MSDTVLSRGFIGKLVVPLSEEQLEEISETLYDLGVNLHFSYDGTLIYNDIVDRGSRTDIYLFQVGKMKDELPLKQQFIDLSRQHGFDVIEDTVLPYQCVWYNGSDPPIAMMELERYVSILKEQV